MTFHHDSQGSQVWFSSREVLARMIAQRAAQEREKPVSVRAAVAYLRTLPTHLPRRLRQHERLAVFNLSTNGSLKLALVAHSFKDRVTGGPVILVGQMLAHLLNEIEVCEVHESREKERNKAVSHTSRRSSRQPQVRPRLGQHWLLAS